MEHKPQGEMICPVCKKVFYCTYYDYWAYKKQWGNNKYIFCSWKCFREKQKEVESKRKKRGRKRRDESGIYENIKTAAVSPGGGSGHGC